MRLLIRCGEVAADTGQQKLEIVAGLSLRNLKPRVWEPESPYYLPSLRAVMASYADLIRMPSLRHSIIENGLHAGLGIPESVSIYLDNGAFNFAMSGSDISREQYAEFVSCAKPDWYAIPQDYIPTPRMSDEEQLGCLERTMQVNLDYSHDGFVPIVHISRHLEEYLEKFQKSAKLQCKSAVGLGGIVPNLLRMPRAMPYDDMLHNVNRVRTAFADKELHVFGIGGTATLHLAALFGMDSVDSSGWRNRAARGIIQLQGCGDRLVAELGKWRGRRLNAEEERQLSECQCPSCQKFGTGGLKERGIEGFNKRATHNLWTLLEEAKLVEQHISEGTYAGWYPKHLNNSTYRPLVDKVIGIL